MKETGFSFVETVIACTILCMVIGFVVPIFRSGMWNETDVQIHEDAREIAQNEIEKLLAMPLSKLKIGQQVQHIPRRNQSKLYFQLHTWVKNESNRLLELEVKVEWYGSSPETQSHQFTLHSYRLLPISKKSISLDNL